MITLRPPRPSFARPSMAAAALSLVSFGGAYADLPAAQVAEAPARTYHHWVQVGANNDEAASQAQWQRMQGTVAGLAANVGNRIQRADLGARGVYYRIQIGPFTSAADAGRLCAQLKARQIECFLPPPEVATAAAPPPAAEQPAKAAPAAPAPKNVATPAPEKSAAKPSAPTPDKKRAAKPAEAMPNAVPIEKRDEKATAQKESDPGKPASDRSPSHNASADKNDAPLSTAPGLPGVLD